MAMNGLILVCISGFLLIFYDPMFQRNFRRYKYYRNAKKSATKKNKKLLVIGCPKAGGVSGKISYYFNLYGCGDVLVDSCENSPCPNHLKADALEFLLRQRNSEFVIFVSVVLEYIPNLEKLIPELYRVSGGDLFVVPIDIIYEKVFPVNLGRYNYLNRVNLITKFPPRDNKIEFRRIKNEDI